MKKSVLVAALTMCLMTSGIASASFFSNLGSKISSSAKSVEHKIKPPKAPKNLTTQKVKDQEMANLKKNTAITNLTGSNGGTVDMGEMTGRQKKLLRTMSIGLALAGQSNIIMQQALGMPANDDVSAMNLLKQEPTQDNISKAAKLLKNSNKGISSKQYLALAQGTDEQHQTLETAMEQSRRYRFASYIVLGLAAKDAIGLGKDAGSAIKTMGVLDAAKSKEVKGIVSTANMAKGLLGSTQSEFSEYDKNSHEAKQLLNPKEAKSTDADVADLAKKAMDGGFFF